MQTSLHGGRKGSPPPPISDRNQEEDNCSEGDSEGEDYSYLPPEVFFSNLACDVGYIMHMAYLCTHKRGAQHMRGALRHIT